MSASFRLSAAALPVLLAAAALPSASANPEPWLLGDPGDRIAVVAAVPGDEALYCAGVLQECAALDLPALVFFGAPTDAESNLIVDAAARLGLHGDSLDLLPDPGTQLPSLLPPFAPSHIVLTRPDPALFALVAQAFPDPATQPVLLLPASNPQSADLLLELAPYELDARAAALRIYGQSPPTADTEAFAELEIDDLPVLSAPPSPSPSPSPVVHPVPEPPPAEPAVAQPAPSPLRPRTRLPSLPPPPPPEKRPASWLDEPVVW